MRFTLFAALMSAQALAADWKPFDAGDYTVSFPGEPSVSSRTDDIEVGQVKSTTAKLESEHQAFSATLTEYPLEHVKKLIPAKMLEGAVAAAVANLGGTLDKDFGVFLDAAEPKKKWPGREFVLHTDKGAVMVGRLYLVNNRLYQLLLARDAAVKDEGEFARFADSFKLKPPPAPEKPDKPDKAAKKR